MKLFEKIGQQIEDLLHSPGRELGRWTRLLRYQIQLWRFCAVQLRKDNAMAMSAALSFRTIFALIPTLVLGLLVAKSLGVLDDSKKGLEELLNRGGLNIAVSYESDDEDSVEGASNSASPSGNVESSAGTNGPAQVNVADTIQELVGKVEKQLTFGRIGPIGVALLIWTSLTLITTVERSLNRIYGARQSRGIGKRVMLYWAVLTLGPIILVVARYVGERVMNVSVDMPVVGWLVASLGWLQTVVVGILLLAFIYKLLPNTQVSFRAALGGALIAVPLWLFFKWLFGLYIQEVVVARASLYGALGLMPLFFMWVNWSWLIFLFGAELSQTAANLKHMESAELASRMTLGPTEMLATALSVAGPFHIGEGPVGFGRIVEQLQLPEQAIQQLLDRLADRGLICAVDRERDVAYAPARPIDQISVLEVFEVDHASGAKPMELYDETIRNKVDQVKHKTREALGGMSLADIIQD